MASVEGKRAITLACGRYLSFFTQKLALKRAEYSAYLIHNTPTHSPSGESTLHGLLARDEELIVCVSENLEASLNHSWNGDGCEDSIGWSSSGSTNQSTDIRGGISQHSDLKNDVQDERVEWSRLETAINKLSSAAVPAKTSKPTSNVGTTLPPLQLEPKTPDVPAEVQNPLGTPWHVSGSSRVAPTSLTNSPSSGSIRDRLKITNII
jgi:hypothetical protein